MRKLHWPSGIAALAICLVIAGCGHGGAALAGGSGNQSTAAGEGAHGAPGQNGSAGAKGIPAGGNGDTGGPKAPESPLTIPDIQNASTYSLSTARRLLIYGEDPKDNPVIDSRIPGFIEECGGYLCVTIDTKPGPAEFDADSHQVCEFLGHTEPDLGGTILPHRTVYLLTGTQPCTSPPDGGDSSADGSPPGDGQVTDTGSPPDGTGPTPADTGPSPAVTSPSAADGGPSPDVSTSP